MQDIAVTDASRLATTMICANGSRSPVHDRDDPDVTIKPVERPGPLCLSVNLLREGYIFAICVSVSHISIIIPRTN